MAVLRVENRVREGGHHVPEEVIRRRIHLGWRNFQKLYRNIVDEWVLYDTSRETPDLLAEGRFYEREEEGKARAHKGRKG